MKWDHMRYYIWQQEVGESGTPHIQGYFISTSSIRLTGARSLFTMHPHLEKRSQSHEIARDYCKKATFDGALKNEHGDEPAGPGHRSDCALAAALVVSGQTDSQIAILYPEIFMRNHRGISALRAAINSSSPPALLPNTFLLKGPTGSGKSRFVQEVFGHNCFWFTTSPSGCWWDGYSGQETIIIDDVKPGTIGYLDLLRMLDRYPCRMAVKTTFTWRAATTINVVLTSNVEIEDWYSLLFEKGYGTPYEVRRRISTTIEFPIGDVQRLALVNGIHTDIRGED